MQVNQKITIIPENAKWSAFQWRNTLLDQLDIANWGIAKPIISHQDQKFLSEL